MAADNGPKVNPPPPGPVPHGPYEYLIVPPLKPVAPDMPFYYAFTAYQQIESEIKMRMSTADRIDLYDGRRIYRVLIQYMWRFDHDKIGSFIGRNPLPVFRFTLDDPSVGIATLNEWEAIG